MSSPINRRKFLSRTVQTTGAAFAMQSFVARGALAASGDGAKRKKKCDGDYGDLAPTPSENTGELLLALPAGFKYNAFGRTGEIMTDGRPTPAAHDGMAAFETPDSDDDGVCRDNNDRGRDRRHYGWDRGKRKDRKELVTLVRNHEIRTSRPGVALEPAKSYDPTVGGGATNLVIDLETRLPIRSFVSLSGTHTNCAGGPTPWGSWMTCEETTIGVNAGFSQPHGYVFDVSAKAQGPVNPIPLKAMGRFSHEALAVDARTNIVYLTEDSNPCGLYRYVPDDRRDPLAGGRLQVLAIKDSPNYDTRTGQTPFQPQRVTWVDIPDPDPSNAESNGRAVFTQGAAGGAASFSRLEGIWYSGDGSLFFNSTDGGNARLGQVWKYRPRGDGGVLSLVFESPSADILDAPDNITVTPGGGLILCEDGGGEQFLRGLTQQGEIFDFALNVLNDSEFAGATFSPDGDTLFVNIQTPGITLAIWGPWESGAL
ncbi:MAG TPA: alkaline phosphatase PhoX [Blastocatellia bacterium]|nr:alkaline phosphatase PhoX [Blastocatellia bacterium]